MMDEDTDKSDLDTLLEGVLDDDARRGLLAELEILNGMRRTIIERARAS